MFKRCVCVLRGSAFVASDAVAGVHLVPAQSGQFAKRRVKYEHAQLVLHRLHFAFVSFWRDKLNWTADLRSQATWFQMPDPGGVGGVDKEGKGLHPPTWFITWVIGSDWREIQMNSLWQAHMQTHGCAHAHKLIPGLNRLQEKRTRAGGEDVIKGWPVGEGR